MRRIEFLAVAVLVAGLAVSSLHATKVRAVNLEEMTGRAATIFSGRCTGVTVVDDPNVGGPVTVATFDVERTVKGDYGSSVTIRLPGGKIAGVPRFRSGDEVVLFLYGENSAGLSSPVGLGQGKFNVVEDKHGRKIAVREIGGDNLFRGLSTEARTRLGDSLTESERREGIEPAALLDMAENLTP